MYHPAVVADSLSKMEKSLRMSLRAYSLGEVAEMRHRLKDVSWDAGLDKVLPTLPADIQQYIINDLTISQFDWKYFSDRYAMVVNDAGLTVPVSLWPSQQLVFELMQKEEKRLWDEWKEGNINGEPSKASYGSSSPRLGSWG